MSNIIIQGNEINAKKYVEKVTIEGVGEEKTLNPRMIVAKGGNSMTNYSTEEQVIGIWIDGKPLYQKSFYFEDPLSMSSTDIDLNLQNINKVVGYTGFCDQGENAYIPLPYVTRNDGINHYTGVWFNVTQNHSVSFSYRVGGGMSQYFINIYFTLQYTKTTD